MSEREIKFRSHASDAIGVKVLAALGIPVEHCRKAVITFEAGKAVIVEAEYFAVMDMLAGEQRLAEAKVAAKLFRLVEK